MRCKVKTRDCGSALGLWRGDVRNLWADRRQVDDGGSDTALAGGAAQEMAPMPSFAPPRGLTVLRAWRRCRAGDDAWADRTFVNNEELPFCQLPDGDESPRKISPLWFCSLQDRSDLTAAPHRYVMKGA